MERPIDFSRSRRMLCDGCEHQFVVDLAWIDRWEQGKERCPGCSLTCEHEQAPRLTVDPGDRALDAGLVTRLYWYHTSTQLDWPTLDFDPAAKLTAQTRLMMGGEQRVADWTARQRGKALHVGTYEAAIHNMFRRRSDQGDERSQFYLYRVRLEPSAVVRDGWITDPGGLVGDVPLDEVCPPGVDIARYLNWHEDPGGISLALGRGAISSVQRIVIPLPDGWDNDWVRHAVDVIENTDPRADPGTVGSGRLQRFRRPTPPRVSTARRLAAELAHDQPANLRSQFLASATFEDDDDPLRWARSLSALRALLEDPQQVLAEFDGQRPRLVERSRRTDP